jgi:hydrogenase-1 operon protein HyaF
MSGLKDIPVRVERPASPRPGGCGASVAVNARPELTPSALAILHEIESRLQALATSREITGIELRGMITPGEVAGLRAFLGKGQVTARLDALGKTLVQETAVPGVWWVTHHNENDEIISQVVEIAPIPELLLANAVDIRDGLRRLRPRLEVAAEKVVTTYGAPVPSAAPPPDAFRQEANHG